MTQDNRLRSLSLLAFLALAIAIVNWFAMEHYWYWRYRWMDIPMHLAGGVLIAGLAAWAMLYIPSFAHTPLSTRAKLYRIFWTTVAVGVAWEVFEVIIGAPVIGSWALDTTKDLTMDALGALALIAFIRSRFTAREMLSPQES